MLCNKLDKVNVMQQRRVSHAHVSECVAHSKQANASRAGRANFHSTTCNESSLPHLVRVLRCVCERDRLQSQLHDAKHLNCWVHGDRTLPDFRRVASLEPSEYDTWPVKRHQIRWRTDFSSFYCILFHSILLSIKFHGWSTCGCCWTKESPVTKSRKLHHGVLTSFTLDYLLYVLPITGQRSVLASATVLRPPASSREPSMLRTPMKLNTWTFKLQNSLGGMPATKSWTMMISWCQGSQNWEINRYPPHRKEKSWTIFIACFEYYKCLYRRIGGTSVPALLVNDQRASPIDLLTVARIDSSTTTSRELLSSECFHQKTEKWF